MRIRPRSANGGSPNTRCSSSIERTTLLGLAVASAAAPGKPAVALPTPSAPPPSPLPAPGAPPIAARSTPPRAPPAAEQHPDQQQQRRADRDGEQRRQVPASARECGGGAADSARARGCGAPGSRHRLDAFLSAPPGRPAYPLRP